MSASRWDTSVQDGPRFPSFLEKLLNELPPEFWVHLGRSLQELGKAIEILADHWSASTGPESTWVDLYEAFMAGTRRVGEPPEQRRARNEGQEG